MNAPNDNTAPKGLRGWWLSPPRPGMQRLINPLEHRHLRLFGGTRIVGGGIAVFQQHHDHSNEQKHYGQQHAIALGAAGHGVGRCRRLGSGWKGGIGHRDRFLSVLPGAGRCLVCSENQGKASESAGSRHVVSQITTFCVWNHSAMFRSGRTLRS